MSEELLGTTFMSKPTCDNCKHWIPSNNIHSSRFRKCARVAFSNIKSEYKGGDLADDSLANNDDGHVLDDFEAGVIDGSGYFGELLTGAKFSCSLHESLPPPPTID